MSAAIIAQAGAGLLSFVQGLASGQGQAADTAAATNASTGTTTGHKHHHGGALDKLVNAISSALQSAGSGGGTDVNKTITDALTKIFQTGSLGTTGQADTDSDADDSTAASTTGDTTSTANTTNGNQLPDALTQVLKAFGITPQQFQTDLNNAVTAAKSSGQFDPSVLLNNFPTGSVVDTTG